MTARITAIRQETKGDRITLSVKIDKQVVSGLASDAKSLDSSQARIVQRALEYFHKQSAELQRAILSAVNSDEVPRINRTLQLMEWGDHAYKRELWVWAIEAYTHLDSVAEGTGDMQRLVRFKLSLCWMALAIDLRRQGLSLTSKSDRSRLYDAAIDSLCVAIGYFRFYLLNGDPVKHEGHYIALYNEACSLTLIAQYLTERDASERELATMSKEILKHAKPTRLTHETTIRFKVAGLPNSLLAKALEQLEKIPERPGHNDAPFSDTQWLVNLAQGDEDLLMLREHKRRDFAEWSKEKTVGMPWLNSYERCRDLLRKLQGRSAIRVPAVSELIQPNQ
jgi:hypothetical protein